MSRPFPAFWGHALPRRSGLRHRLLRRRAGAACVCGCPIRRPPRRNGLPRHPIRVRPARARPIHLPSHVPGRFRADVRHSSRRRCSGARRAPCRIRRRCRLGGPCLLARHNTGPGEYLRPCCHCRPSSGTRTRWRPRRARRSWAVARAAVPRQCASSGVRGRRAGFSRCPGG